MALGYFETTTGQKQLADIGRKMMDMSEYANCKGMKEEGFKLLNDLSHVGSMLTKVGNTFGPKIDKDFTAEDMDLITRFMKKEIDIPQMVQYTVYNSQGKGAKQMIKTLGWLTVIGLGLFTGILQTMLMLSGAAIIWIGAALSSLGGAL